MGIRIISVDICKFYRRGKAMKKLFYLLFVMGIIALIIVPTWTYAIVPSKMVMPDDINESVTFTGEASVVNPANFSQLMGPFDLNIERTYVGIGNAEGGNAVILDETVIMTIDSPMTPPETRNYLLAVDKKTYEHLKEDGEDWDYARDGQFTFGLHPEKMDTEFWLHDLNDTITAKYDRTTSYKGINVIKYSMNGIVPITKNTELLTTYTGLAYYYGNSNLNTLHLVEDSFVYVDEVSGMIVYFERNSEMTGDFTHIPTGAVFTATLSEMSYQYDDESTDALVSDAKEADSTIVFYEFTMPLIIAAIGISLILIAVVLRIRNKRKEKKQE
jgi:hypothetical protein